MPQCINTSTPYELTGLVDILEGIGADRASISKELKDLSYCFEKNSKVNPESLKESFFALSEEDLRLVRGINNFEELTKRIKETLDSEIPEQERYFEVAKLLNKVIYYQYKSNIVREENKAEMSTARTNVVNGYLSVMDKALSFANNSLSHGIQKKIGHLGSPSLRQQRCR